MLHEELNKAQRDYVNKCYNSVTKDMIYYTGL